MQPCTYTVGVYIQPTLFFKKKKKGPKLNNLKLFHVGSSPRHLVEAITNNILRKELYIKSLRRSQDGGGVGRGEHFLPHKFIKRAFKRRVNSTKQLLNASRGYHAPRKATQLFERR